MLYSDNLATMTGRVRQIKPNAPASAIRDRINDRIRYLMDSQPFWADLLKQGILSMPAAYVTGQVTMSPNSKVVTGTGTGWPVTDVSNTTLPAGIFELGVQTVAPASMNGIATDAFLYIDASGTPEAVAVLETTRTTFSANFTQRHNPNCTATQSSLAGLQFRLGATYPTYTIRGVHSSTELEIDLAWGAPTLTNSAYEILKMYFTIAPDLKDIVNLWDPTQGRPLVFHKSQDFLNARDPQRTATSVPLCLADYIPTEGGSMQYELWPHQTIAYQIPVLYCRQWPMLKNPTDRPPSFINPSMIVDGAVADSLRARDQLVGSEQADPFFDPKTAQIYEVKFQAGMEAAMNANDSKCLRALEDFRSQWGGFMPGGNWQQSHIPDGDWPGLGDW